MEYRREIDGLRALAVLPVIFFHAGWSMFRGGYVGVDVFFVISGYLITTLVFGELQAGKFSIVRFYERRARRLMPALFAVMLACVPLAWLWMMPYQLVGLAKSFLAVLMFSSNILFWRETGYFNSLNELKPLLHTWSLSVEEQYYLVFPLCSILCFKFARRWLLPTLAVAFVGSLAAAEYGWRTYPEATFYLAPTRAWEILLGALIAVYHLDRVPRASTSAGPRIGDEIGAALGLGLIVAAVGWFDAGTPAPSLHTLVPTLGAGLVIMFATPQTLFGRLLGHRIPVLVGMASYSIYLWHQPLFAFARVRSISELGPLATGLLALLSIAVGFASWRFIERPFRDPHRFGRRLIFSGTASMAGLVAILAGIGLKGHGFANRFPAGDRAIAEIDPSNHGAYVTKRFDQLRLAPFEAGKRKVFIAGDSFAEDFVNIYAENGYLSDCTVSTYHISSRWGVLFTQADLSAHVSPTEQAACKRAGGRFESPAVQARIREADVVFLVSFWQKWQVAYLNETISALRKCGAQKVVVIGRKDFGFWAPHKYLGLTAAEKSRWRNPVSEPARQVNESMRASLPPDAFVDFQTVVFEDADSSPSFDPGLNLLSYDGVHLTPAGARYVGPRLFAHPLLAGLK